MADLIAQLAERAAMSEPEPMPDGWGLPLKQEVRDGVTWTIWPGTKELLPMEFPRDPACDHTQEEIHLRNCAWNAVHWVAIGRLDLLKGHLR